MEMADFVKASALLDKSESEKAQLFAYYLYKTRGKNEFAIQTILDCFDSEHLSIPNASRLKKNLVGSGGFVADNDKGLFKLHARTIVTLDNKFETNFVTSAKRPKTGGAHFIDASRIMELEALRPTDFDLRKLLKICDEINRNYSDQCSLAAGMLVRALIDHVPPIFNLRNFSEVANNYSGGGKSFRDSMQRLDQSSRKIADQYLHTQIRKSESLPTLTQVDFSPEVDVLLGEIVRVLRRA